MKTSYNKNFNQLSKSERFSDTIGKINLNNTLMKSIISFKDKYI